MTQNQTKCTQNLFINITLLTQNQMYLKHPLFNATRMCNGMKDTHYFYA